MARGKTDARPGACARSALAAALGTAAAVALGPSGARAAEPFCDWVSGIAGAAQALADGRPAAAEAEARRALGARPRGEAGGQARAALGLALAAEGRSGAAAEVLGSALEELHGPERNALLLARGEALLAAGHAADAAAVLGEAAAAGGAAARRAEWRVPDALLAAGLAPQAVPRLEALLAASPRDGRAPAARLALAGALRHLGQDARAVALYRELWLDAPERPEGRAAADALAAWRERGGPVPAPTGADRLARAERLLEIGRPEEALAELDAADDPPAEPGRAGAARALALTTLGRHAEAERLAAPLAASADPTIRRSADLVLARAAARGGRVDEAIAAYRRVAGSEAVIAGLPEWRQRELSDEAAYLAAWLPYDAGQYARAIGTLDAFARSHPRARRADEARWFSAWSRIRLGRDGEARRTLARLERGPLAPAALYWSARVSAGGARRALYRRAAEADPSGWYGLLARARLAALHERSAPLAAPDPRPLPDPPAEGWGLAVRTAADLLGLGMREAALAELSAVAASPDARAAASLVAQLAAFGGDAELPFRMARDHLLPTRRALRWSYPEAAPHLLPGARALGVEPALLLALMRRESGFRADARSFAGAQGLLQLVAPTAERLAAVLGLPPDPARLGDPDANVGLGAHYLALLEDRFGEDALVAAAYNAGPRPVAGWATERSGMPLDAWIESIPWRESREYVKIVLPMQAIYRDLWGEPGQPIDPARPVRAPKEGVAF